MRMPPIIDICQHLSGTLTFVHAPPAKGMHPAEQASADFWIPSRNNQSSGSIPPPPPPAPAALTRRSGGIWAHAPDILLILLFEHGARAALHDTGLPFAVRASHVCRAWRAVALGSPAVWACMPVHPRRPGLAQALLQRAGAHVPLALCVHLRGVRGANATLELVLREHRRIRELHLRAQGNPAVFVFVERLRRLPALPRLVRFEIHLVKNTSGEFLGHLPHVLDGAPPGELASVSLRGVCFEYHSVMLRGLTSLTLADLPLRMAAPSYTTFRDLLLASPNLVHLSLDGVFPVLTSKIDYGIIELQGLRSLEVVLNRVVLFIPSFFDIMFAPNLDTLAFESSLVPNWEGFEDALPILQTTFFALRTLRLTTTGDENALANADMSPALFQCFPQLEYITLSAHADRLALRCLRAWLAYPAAWPRLQLLTVRAPFDLDDDDDADGIDDMLEFLGSLRLSVGLPFEVWQECVGVP